MNILFCNDTPLIPNLGGVERVSTLLATFFQNSGHKVFFFSNCKEPSNIIYPDNIKRYYSPSNTIGDYATLDRIITDKKIDVIINQSIDPDIHNLLKQIHNGHGHAKIITVIHNQPFSTQGKERLYKKLLSPLTLKGRLLKNLAICFPLLYQRGRLNHDRDILNKFFELSDIICLLSERYIPRIQKLMPDIPNHKLFAINNPNTFEGIESDSEKENIVLFIGRLYDPQKNVTGFINVWNLFKETHPDWKAIILGDGNDRRKLEQYAKSSGAKDLEFKGNQRDVAKYYSKAKILCMTSLYEGWPMVLPEAMYYECVPVIYNSYEAAEDIIDTDVNGFLIPPFNQRKMVDKLSLLADNDFLRREMAKKAKNKIQKFNISNIAEDWLKLFESFI